MARAASVRGPVPELARAIARAAYVFLYPLVVNYGAAYETEIDQTSASAGFGRWRRWRDGVHTPRRGRPVVEHRACAWLDLGPEPWILMSQPAEPGRSSTHCLDLWGFRPEVDGVDRRRRASGASILMSGLSRDDPLPHGVEMRVRSETRLVRVYCAGQLDSTGDRRCPGAVEVPRLMPLSAYLGRDAPPPIATPWFRWHDGVSSDPEFWACASFALSLTWPHPDDLGILEVLRRIGIGAGAPLRHDAFGDDVLRALDMGMYEAIDDLLCGAFGEAGVGRSRGSRRQMDNDYLARAVATLVQPNWQSSQPI